MTGPPAALAEELSHEFTVGCAADGTIRWLDARAERLLGTRPGTRLQDLCAPGTADKADTLLGQGRQGRLDGWELSLVLGGRPVTVSFAAALDAEGRLWLIGAQIPEHFTRALATVEKATSEIVELHRRLVSQHRELERRHEELVRVTGELDESQCGLLTMHAEIREHSQEMQRQAEIRRRVLASASHELRTPLHAILGLGELLAEGADGSLNAEQHKQVEFIRSAAAEMLQMVDDVLDLTRAEAGRAALRTERFTMVEFIAALRGMLRPLAPADGPVALIWDEAARDVLLETDRGKLAQVVRNLVSNALKFTERGVVRVRAELDRDEDTVRITVTDSGIGIAEADLERIFEEFVQIDSPQQRRFKGTGLGLPLSRRLVEALGGELAVTSEPGVGSTFTVTIPRVHPEAAEMRAIEDRSRRAPAGPASVLLVEDDRRTFFIHEKYLKLAGFGVIPARDIASARAALARTRPAAILLDVMLENETSWEFLGDLKRDPATADIPVLVVTVADYEERARALGADEFWLKPLRRERLLRKLDGLVRRGPAPRVLVVDDDDKARYVLRRQLQGSPYEVLEANSASAGVAAARSQRPDVILLDFMLRDETAFEVLDALKTDPRTRAIPVVIVTSHVLDDASEQRLLAQTEAVVRKQDLSRALAIDRIRDALARAGGASIRRS
ncbi:ATP-binding response regulator [Nannocystis pusilla]|uniref:histidine kinase n=1 Tax=Nannocystis pusilla TaxID=889268 RepID=A0ABS7TY02_9BACT|nr:response regulator [Nannocystis pusilla]